MSSNYEYTGLGEIFKLMFIKEKILFFRLVYAFFLERSYVIYDTKRLNIGWLCDCASE